MAISVKNRDVLRDYFRPHIYAKESSTFLEGAVLHFSEHPDAAANIANRFQQMNSEIIEHRVHT